MATNQCYIARKNKSDSTYDEGRWWVQNGILGPAPEFITRQFCDIVGGGFQVESIGTFRDVLLKLGVLKPETDADRSMLAEHASFIVSGTVSEEKEPETEELAGDPLAGLVVPSEEKKDIQSMLSAIAIPPEQLASFEYRKLVKEMRDAGISFKDLGMNGQPSKEDAFRAYILFSGGKI